MAEEISTKTLLARVQEQARSLIVGALRTRAISLSSFESSRTGNRYQSVRFGDKAEPGFRSGERNVFAGIPVQRRTVVDLGCNLGEVCRDAIRAGALRVTGLEYDDYFIQIARYVTAFNGLNGIDYHQTDLTKPEAYAGKYDYVVALSVYRYIKDHLGLVAAMTKRVLILETHNISDDWYEWYVAPLRRHFAHVAVAGFSDHKAKSKAEVRYIILASHTKLDAPLARRAREVSSPFTIDAAKSSVPHYDAVLKGMGVDRPVTLGALIEAFSKPVTPEDVLEAVQTTPMIEAAVYWRAFLQGYRAFKEAGRLSEDNIYFRSFRLMIERGAYHGALVKLMLETPEVARVRLEQRYRMLRRWETQQDGIGDPLILYTIMPLTEPKWSLYVSPAEECVTPLAIDGHHRLFLAYALGLRVPFLPMWSADIPPVSKALRENPELTENLWSQVYPLSKALWR